MRSRRARYLISQQRKGVVFYRIFTSRAVSRRNCICKIASACTSKYENLLTPDALWAHQHIADKINGASKFGSAINKPLNRRRSSAFALTCGNPPSNRFVQNSRTHSEAAAGSSSWGY